MSAIPIPEGLSLSPQEWRVFAALQDWADEKAVARAINEPNGKPRYTPPTVIISKLKGKLRPFGIEVECNIGTYDRRPRMWRVVRREEAVAA